MLYLLLLELGRELAVEGMGVVWLTVDLRGRLEPCKGRQGFLDQSHWRGLLWARFHRHKLDIVVIVALWLGLALME